jgi:alkanesulfonate monooxygenase SsuD/methylene tetrahydromethanopterin reductase-like flavin-dependent oxidoreductase (luciferase family)
MQTDYDEAGMPYDRIGLRIERLDEALRICRAMWTQEKTSFEGKHYTITDIAQAAPLPPGSAPKVLVGGGGQRVLGLAGRHADIIGINPTMKEGRITNETAADLSPDRTQQKIEWARAAASAAGRDPDALEFNSLVFVVALTDDPSGIRGALSKSSGMSEDEVADCPLFLTGPASEIRDRLELRREKTGISYVVIQGRDHDLVERFAEEVVAPLQGR